MDLHNYSESPEEEPASQEANRTAGGARELQSDWRRTSSDYGGSPPPDQGSQSSMEETEPEPSSPPSQAPLGYHVPPPPPIPPLEESGPGRKRPSFFNILFGLVFAVVFLFFVGVCAFAAAYVAIAADLPSPETLRGRTATFVSTKIYDRDGHLLHEIFDPNGGRRTIVPYEEISPFLIDATVATEDERFWQHPGVDPIGILRAAFYNVQEGHIVSGASTIPQQLARLVLLSPEERAEISVRRKLREAVLASEITRRYSKNEILQIYLNEINYGSLAYGIGAASETYFGKKASELTLAEAALLAGLPQAPAYWDPYTNQDRAKSRQVVVLDLMVDAGYITQNQAREAKEEPLHLVPLSFDFESPHFVVWVQQLLEQKYGADVLYRSGLQVTTTLDSGLQDLAQRHAQTHIASLVDRNATNAALVSIQPDTGEVLAMLGSVDFYDAEIAGQVNVALSPRQPGSSIKPVTYVSAFERGWTPATLIWDVTTQFQDASGQTYVPKNYDGKEHGPVLLRSALAQSLNIPAVKALEFVGLPAMLDTAHRLGIASLTRPDYGLSLTLGGGEVTLLEMTGAYAVFANGGQRVPPVAILRIEDYAGNIIEEYQPPPGEQVVSPQHAYLITDILSDNAARTPVYGRDSALKLSRTAAAKTGTTDDWRDSWTIGYSPDLVTGVWVGNSDGSAMNDVPGSRGAAPIWHNFMEDALAEQPDKQFPRPEGIEEIEISSEAGSLPSEACPPDRRRREIFASGQGPLGPEHDFHQYIRIDTSTGALTTEYCPANVIDLRYYYVLPGAEGQMWAQRHNIPQPPFEFCPVHTGPAQVAIFQPVPGETVSTEAHVVGRANIPDFAYYVVEYGEGQFPSSWWLAAGPVYSPIDSGLLAVWNVSTLLDRDYALRVVVYDRAGNSAEAKTWVWVRNPTPTPRPTATLTPTLTYTPTPSATATISVTATTSPTVTSEPTDTPGPTDTPTVTSVPTDTLTPTDTPWPTDTPSATDTPGPTDTPWPTDTAVPTDTLAPPTDTPSPTDTPWPTDTAVPTDTLTPTPTFTPFPTWTPLPIISPTVESLL